MVEAVDEAVVFAGSDGRYYTDWQVDRNLRTGAWRPCLEELTTGRRLVGVDDELVLLEPAEVEGLPDWICIQRDEAGPRVIDVRRTGPPGTR